jgi:small-conductance mechanosensitive channel
MNSPGPAQAPFYVELAVLSVGLILAVAIYFLWRAILRKIRGTGDQPVFAFIGKISLPVIFLGVALVLNLDFWAKSFSLGPEFSQYLNAAIIFLVVFLVIRLIDAGLGYRYERLRRPFPLPGILRGFFLAVIYLAVLFVILKGILGINISPFLATSAIFTAIIGLALQGVLSNALAGISLNLTKSLSRGDWVKIGPHEGVVIDTNWRETLVLDRATNVVVIPNNTVASEMIVNFSRPDLKTALTIPLKVSYSAPASEVLDILREAAREVPEVLATPAPQAYILSYDDYGISYLVKYWVTDFARKHTINGDVARHIWYKFRRRNFEIPVALAESVKEAVLTLKTEARQKAEEELGEKNYQDLFQSQLFRQAEGEMAGELLVSPQDVRLLSHLAKRRVYTRGEVIFRQGEKGESCYIVADGLVRGEVIYEEKGKRFTSEFETGRGGLVGEMSLFTGLPRTATVIIDRDAELLEVKASDFARLLSQNPRIAEVMADLVAARNQKNADFLRKIKELSEQEVEESANKNWVLAHLKKLVSLFHKSE